jgi:hypothetical protein
MDETQILGGVRDQEHLSSAEAAAHADPEYCEFCGFYAGFGCECDSEDS